MLEAGVVIMKGVEAGTLRLHWHLPPGRSTGSIPDSRELWDVFWENRDDLVGFAHTHPGKGTPRPSQEDVSTFYAVEEGLGSRVLWWIFSEDRGILVTTHPSGQGVVWVPLRETFSWLPELRRLSYGP